MLVSVTSDERNHVGYTTNRAIWNVSKLSSANLGTFYSTKGLQIHNLSESISIWVHGRLTLFSNPKSLSWCRRGIGHKQLIVVTIEYITQRTLKVASSGAWL